MSKMMEMATKDILVADNVRTITSGAADKELIESVKTQGVIEPVIVRRENKQFILIAGHRRVMAAKKAGLKQVPVRILDVTKEKAKEIQVIENLQRRDLTPLEEAEAYRALLEFNGTQKIWDHQGKKVLPTAEFNRRVGLVAKVVGKNINYVLRVLRLTELPALVKDWITRGKLTAMHGALLVDLPKLGIEKVVKDFLVPRLKHLSKDDVFPVSELRNYIDKAFMKDLSNAPFPTNCGFAGEVACTACPYNSGNSMSLFGKGELGNCRQGSCFNKKREQVYRDIRDNKQKKMPAKLKFGGFGRISHGWDGKKIPSAIRGMPVTALNSKTIAVAGKNPDVFRWGIIKPATDSKTPQIKTVLLLSDPVKGGKLLGIKSKTAPAAKKEDWERSRFIRDAVDEALDKAVAVALKNLKPGKEWMQKFLRLEYENNTEAWDAVAELYGIKMKGKYPTDNLEDNQIGLLLFAVRLISEHGASELIGVDENKIKAEVAKTAGAEYDAKKAKATETK